MYNTLYEQSIPLWPAGDLGAPSTVQSAIKSLVKKGLVNREENKYWPVDPFFAMWLAGKAS